MAFQAVYVLPLPCNEKSRAVRLFVAARKLHPAGALQPMFLEVPLVVSNCKVDNADICQRQLPDIPNIFHVSQGLIVGNSSSGLTVFLSCKRTASNAIFDVYSLTLPPNFSLTPSTSNTPHLRFNHLRGFPLKDLVGAIGPHLFGGAKSGRNLPYMDASHLFASPGEQDGGAESRGTAKALGKQGNYVVQAQRLLPAGAGYAVAAVSLSVYVAALCFLRWDPESTTWRFCSVREEGQAKAMLKPLVVEENENKGQAVAAGDGSVVLTYGPSSGTVQIIRVLDKNGDQITIKMTGKALPWTGVDVAVVSPAGGFAMLQGRNRKNQVMFAAVHLGMGVVLDLMLTEYFVAIAEACHGQPVLMTCTDERIVLIRPDCHMYLIDPGDIAVMFEDKTMPEFAPQPSRRLAVAPGKVPKELATKHADITPPSCSFHGVQLACCLTSGGTAADTADPQARAVQPESSIAELTAETAPPDMPRTRSQRRAQQTQPATNSCQQAPPPNAEVLNAVGSCTLDREQEWPAREGERQQDMDVQDLDEHEDDGEVEDAFDTVHEVTEHEVGEREMGQHETNEHDMREHEIHERERDMYINVPLQPIGPQDEMREHEIRGQPHSPPGTNELGSPAPVASAELAVTPHQHSSPATVVAGAQEPLDVGGLPDAPEQGHSQGGETQQRTRARGSEDEEHADSPHSKRSRSHCPVRSSRKLYTQQIVAAASALEMLLDTHEEECGRLEQDNRRRSQHLDLLKEENESLKKDVHFLKEDKCQLLADNQRLSMEVEELKKKIRCRSGHRAGLWVSMAAGGSRGDTDHDAADAASPPAASTRERHARERSRRSTNSHTTGPSPKKQQL